MLLSGETDIAIVSRPLGESVVETKIIFEEDLVLMANKKYSASLKNEGALRLVDMSGDLRLYSEWKSANDKKLKSYKFKPELIASIKSIEGIYQYILSQPCAAVVPLHMVAKDIGKKLVSLYPDANQFKNQLYLCKLKVKRDPDTRIVFEKISQYGKDYI
jgi:DNA-binding transcriptional LysR family regulator